MNILSSQWATRNGKSSDGKIIQHERNYIDFLVDSQCVKTILGYADNDLITLLGWFKYSADDELMIEEFLKQNISNLKSGRTVIYGCPECGDLGCGAITAEIVEMDNKIIWKNFAYENEDESYDVEKLKKTTPFEFDKQQYISEFAKISKEINKTPREY